MSDYIDEQKGFGLSEYLAEWLEDDAGERLKVSAPTTREELAEFVEKYFGLRVARRAVCPHHDAPLDYLAASFFGQQDLLVWANRGGGKTLIAAAATLLDAIFRAPTSIRVLGGSFDQSNRLAEYVRAMLECQPALLAGRPTRQRVQLVGGSDIEMLSQSQHAVRGQHVQKIRCDEVDLFDADVWQAVQFATRSAGRARGSIEVLSTLHRPGGLMHDLVAKAAASPPPTTAGHGYRLVRWCLWEVIERCDESRRCEDCPLAEDCDGKARQADGFYQIDDAIAVKSRSSRAAWEAEMLCTGARREQVVFGEFDRRLHVRQLKWQADWPTYRAIDFGYRSPLVCLWVQVTPGGCVHVIDEYVRTQLPIAQHAAEILRRDPPGRVAMTYVDPAGRQREATSGAACTELLAASGIPCAWRTSSIADGLECIRAALAPADGAATLAIDPRCVKLIEAFENYHYAQPGQGDPERPVKDGPDHCIDALRYFFVNRMRPGGGVKRARY